MGQRLECAPIAVAGKAISFEFDGEVVAALDGESLAAAFAAAGIRNQRWTASATARGGFCGMGVCYDCLVVVDGKRSQRACMTRARSGMVVARQRDCEERPYAVLADPPVGESNVRCCELLVVGAGPGGLSSAIAAAQTGVRVLVVDERPYAGGQYYKPLAPSHTVSPGHSLDKQFTDGARLFAKACDVGVEFMHDASVWRGEQDASGTFNVGLLRDGVAGSVEARSVIVATGAYERPLPVPGWTLPGVMTTGAAQVLARAYRVCAGTRVLIAGNGPLNFQVACELTRGGVDVVAVVEAASAPWHRPWRALRAAALAPALMTQGLGYLATLKRSAVEIIYGHALSRVLGNAAVEAGVVSSLDVADGKHASTREFDVDTVCMGYGFSPASTLARQLGCKSRFDDNGQIAVARDAVGRTSVPSVYVVGEAGGIGGAHIALNQGALAGRAAAQALDNTMTLAPQPPRMRLIRWQLRRHKLFQEALGQLFVGRYNPLQMADGDTILCRCEDVDFKCVRKLVADGVRDLGSVKRLTRAGMGRCQGRYCGPLLSALMRERDATSISVDECFAPQMPLVSVPLAALGVEQSEWTGHRRDPLPAVAACSPMPSALAETDVLVIGAGIAGVCVARCLAAAGREVTIVEAGTPNAQASGANAGSLHVQLLSFDFGAKAPQGGGPAAATIALQRAAVSLWRDLESALDAGFEIRVEGGLMVAEDDEQLAFLRAKVALERANGVASELLDRHELRALAPAVSSVMVGAAFCPDEGKINPLRATFALLSDALNRGARLLDHTRVLSIERERSGAYLVHTNRGRVRSARIVNAAGPWAGQIAAMLDINLPVHGAPLQMIATEPVAPLIDKLVAHASRHLSLKQVKNGNIVIGGGWPARLDTATGYMRVRPNSLAGNLWVAQRVVPALANVHVLRSWGAMNVDIDGAPVLGEVPGHAGFFNAVSSNGYTLGPIVGEITCELLMRKHVSWDLSPFQISRFKAGNQ